MITIRALSEGYTVADQVRGWEVAAPTLAQALCRVAERFGQRITVLNLEPARPAPPGPTRAYGLGAGPAFDDPEVPPQAVAQFAAALGEDGTCLGSSCTAD